MESALFKSLYHIFNIQHGLQLCFIVRLMNTVSVKMWGHITILKILFMGIITFLFF